MKSATDNSTIANELALSIKQAITTKTPTALVRHLAKQAVWRDDNNVYVGRDEIWSALNNSWANSLICTTDLQVGACDAQLVHLKLNSEWQHAKCGRWFRTEIDVRITLDEHSLISAVESTGNTEKISAADRQLAISLATHSRPSGHSKSAIKFNRSTN